MRNVTLRYVLFALAAIFPIAAFARLEFKTVRQSAALPGSELCFSRIDPKAPSPIVKYFTGEEVRCTSADFVLDVPPGRWTFFARNMNGFVGRHRTLFTYSGGPENTYRGSELEMDEAAYVDFTGVPSTLAPGERAYAVVGPTSEHLQHVIPLLDGEMTVMVPPGTVVPVIARKGAIVRVGVPMQLRPTDSQKARFDGTGRTVIAWSKVEAGTPKERMQALRDIAPPEVVLTTAKGEELKPVYPIVFGHDTGETLQFFMSVPPGDVRVTLRGGAWTTTTVRVQGDGPLTIAPPLEVRPASIIKVSARVPEVPDTSCDAPAASGTPATSIVLLRCPPDTGVDEARALCREVAVRNAADVEFVSVPPGAYVVELRHPPFRSVYQPVSAEGGKAQRIELQLEARLLTGRIVRRGVPVHARLDLERFPSATGNGGAYALPFPDTVVEGRPLRITACDGSFAYVHVITTEPLPNAPYDITIPDTAMKVRVLADAGPADGITGAKVRYQVLSEKHDRVRWSQTTAAADGTATFDPVVAELPIRFCAFAADYELTCSEPVALTRDAADREITLRLRRSSSRHGRVVAQRALIGGRLYWTAPDGTVTEAANVEPDGTFVLTRPHGASEHVAIASFSHSLLLAVPAASDSAEVVLDVPELPATAIRVELRNARPSPSLVALHLGGRHVPVDALLYHQAARRLQYLLHGSALVIPDVAVQGPVSVTMGPDVATLAARGSGMTFSEPLCAVYESKVVPASGSVIFD